VLLFGFCQGQKERQEGDRQAVVEPGLDVEGLADAYRDARVAYDRLAQRRVGRREDGTYDCCFPEREVGEQQRCGSGPQCDGERHSYAQEAQGQCLILLQGRDVGPRGVGEQHDREGDLTQQEYGVVVETELNQAKPRGTKDDARRDEHERRCENRSLQPARNETESEDNDSQHGEINHRRLQGCGTYPDQASSIRTFLSLPLCRIRGGIAEIGRRLSAERPGRRSWGCL
jgi:hypothetical protein